MKKLTTKLNFWLATLSACFFMYSCSQEDLENVSSDAVQNLETDVRVINGYLEFDSFETLDSLNRLFKNESREKLDSWESQFNDFTSFRHLEEQSIDAQDDWFSQLGKMTEAEISTIKRTDEKYMYSPFLKENSSRFILLDSGMYDLNINGGARSIAPFINKDGVIKVNGKIYKHTKNQIKVIEDGDDSKLSILPNIEHTDEELNITVIEDVVLYSNNNKNKNNRQTFSTASSYSKQVCADNNGDDRVTGELRVEIVPSFSSGYNGAVFVFVENWNKSIWGYSRKRTSEMIISGDLTLFSYTNGVYSNQVSYNNIYATTGGNHWKTLTYKAEVPPYGWCCTSSISVTASGNITIQGRNGTTCGDLPSYSHNCDPNTGICEDEWR